MMTTDIARKLILAPMALACLIGSAVAQQAPTSTADQGKPGAAPWPVSWTGQSVLADLRVAGSPVAAGNPLPVTIGNFPATQTIAGSVTANIGTTNGLGLDTSLQAIRTALGSPLQAGGSVGISGTPTVNLGTLNGAATAANQATANSSLASIVTNTTGASTAANQASEIAALQAANQRTSYFSDAVNVSVSANGAYGSASRDAGASPSAFAKFNAYFYSTQSGTAQIYGTDNNVDFYPIYSQPLAAFTALTPSGLPITFRYYLCKIQNGATAATINIRSSFTIN